MVVLTPKGDADRKNWAAADVIRGMGPVGFDVDLAIAFTLVMQLQFAAGHPIAGRSAAARSAARFVDGLIRNVPDQVRPLFELCLPGRAASDRPSGEDLAELAEWGMHVEISPGTALALLAQLGIALKHPANRGLSAALVREVALGLRSEFPKEIPALDGILGDVLRPDWPGSTPSTDG